jgi:hypothetical protein
VETSNHLQPSRRVFLKAAGALAAAGPIGLFSAATAGAVPGNVALAIGSRRELFVDQFLIDRLDGGIEQRLHHPVPREIALLHDAPWEGSGSGYHSVFRDDDVYRMYYKSWHLDVTEAGLNTGRHPLFCCYAESDDGIHWRKPDLGLHEFQGSKQNNIVLVGGKQGPLNIDAGHPAVFKDENPNAAPDALYKAIVRSAGPSGLIPLKSPDGIHFTPMTDAPILQGLGAFDSQNLAFWDPVLKKYRAYWRIFTSGVTNDAEWKPAGHRAIRTATSDDLVHWSEPVDLTYDDSPSEHLYTNQIKHYHRAPHILMGFPARYVDRGWSDAMRALPELEHRELRAAASERYGTALTDGLFMTSRDGAHFKRWNEAFLRPGIERPDTWNYGQQYIGWHLVETEAALPGAPNELSLYASESYWTDEDSAVRRYTMRLDGFVSLNAPMAGGEVVTKPLTFAGSRLTMNFATSAAGSVRVEIQDPSGKPIDGYALSDCPEHFGDTVERTVRWSNGAGVTDLAGTPVRLRFVLNDANLYAFRFTDEEDAT